MVLGLSLALALMLMGSVRPLRLQGNSQGPSEYSGPDGRAGSTTAKECQFMT